MKFFLPLVLVFLTTLKGEVHATTGLPVSVGPSIKLPSGLVYSVFGGNAQENPGNVLNCYLVMNSVIGYANAQAQGSCYEAQTACIRLGLLQQFMDVGKNATLQDRYPGTTFDKKQLQALFKTSYVDAKLKLMGCAVAAAASLIADSLVDQAGFEPPKNPQATQPHIGIYDNTP